MKYSEDCSSLSTELLPSVNKNSTIPYNYLTLFRMGGGEEGAKKAPLTSFPPVTSTNVGIRPQNFLTFSFNPFD